MEEPASGPDAGEVAGQPLAARMRPRSLGEFVGQEHLLGAGSALRTAIEDGSPHSMILYGPPGTGQDDARPPARRERARGVRGGVGGERRARGGARRDRARPPPAADERRAHDLLPRRDPSLQQGAAGHAAAGGRGGHGRAGRRHHREPLLRGELGAAVALPDLRAALARRTARAGAACSARSGPSGHRASAARWTTTRSSSSRRAPRATRAPRCRALELAAETVGEGGAVTLRVAEDALQRSAILYDKGGDLHYDLISAWIKSTRGSDPDASLLYLAAMIEGGEDPRFIARRMVVLASEDIGNADPRALEVAVDRRARGRARRDARVRAEPGPGGRVPRAGAEVERVVRGDQAGARVGARARHAASRPRRSGAPPTRARRSSAEGSTTTIRTPVRRASRTRS